MDMALELAWYVAIGMLISMLIGLVVLAISWHWLPKKVKDELNGPDMNISVGIIFPMGGW